MNIYIVRHGETDSNKYKKYFGGRIDVPLNDEGIAGAEKVKLELSNITFDKVYSSPLQRAYKTASIITNDEITIDERLIERSNGTLEGMLKSSVPNDIDFNSPYETRYGIENIIIFRKRINDFFNDLKEKDYENVLVVTHAGVIMYATCYFEGLPKNNNYGKYKIPNCGIKKYTFDKSDKNEYLDLFDDYGIPIGKRIIRGDKSVKLNEHEHIALTTIFIENSMGEFLIQKTSPEKGGEYSSTGGHVDSGEIPELTIRRETYEELGIDIYNEPIEDYGYLLYDMPIRHIYYLKKDINLSDIKLQTDEVEYVKYMTPDEINYLIESGKMLQSHGILFNELIKRKTLRKHK